MQQIVFSQLRRHRQQEYQPVLEKISNPLLPHSILLLRQQLYSQPLLSRQIVSATPMGAITSPRSNIWSQLLAVMPPFQKCLVALANKLPSLKRIVRDHLLIPWRVSLIMPAIILLLEERLRIHQAQTMLRLVHLCTRRNIIAKTSKPRHQQHPSSRTPLSRIRRPLIP